MNNSIFKDRVLQLGTDFRSVAKIEDHKAGTIQTLNQFCPIRKTGCDESCSWYSEEGCAIVTGKVEQGKQCPFTSKGCKFADKGEKFCSFGERNGCSFINAITRKD